MQPQPLDAIAGVTDSDGVPGCAGLLADQIEEIRTKNAEIGNGLLIVDSVGMACGTTGDGDPAGPFALGRQDPLWGRRMVRASEG